MKTIEDYEKLIVDLLDDRRITQSSDAKEQFIKFVEEIGELHDESATLSERLDAIGYTYVTLIATNYLFDSTRSIYGMIKQKGCPSHIEDYTEKTAIYYIGQLSRAVQKTDIVKISEATVFFTRYLEDRAESEGFSLRECIMEAYYVISKRNGKWLT